MFSQVHLLGRLGHEPELKALKDGTYVCNLSVAVDHPTDRELPCTWWKVVCWEKRAEFAANWLVKGGRVYVVGVPSLDEWDNDDGEHFARMACTATQIQPVDWADPDREAEEGKKQLPRSGSGSADEKAAAKRQAYGEKVRRHGRLG